LHGTVVVVVELAGGVVTVVVDVVAVVVLVDVAGDVVGELVVEVASLGGPEWQWFLSPWPKPGRHGTDVDETAVAAR
jgi:hypothetical protein